MSDISRALARLRYVCAKHDMPCPDVIGYTHMGRAREAAAELRRIADHAPRSYGINAIATNQKYIAHIQGFGVVFGSDTKDV